MGRPVQRPPDQDPYQNVTDQKHCISAYSFLKVHNNWDTWGEEEEEVGVWGGRSSSGGGKIRTKMSRIRNTASQPTLSLGSQQLRDMGRRGGVGRPVQQRRGQDPNQNVMDQKHCISAYSLFRFTTIGRHGARRRTIFSKIISAYSLSRFTTIGRHGVKRRTIFPIIISVYSLFS